MTTVHAWQHVYAYVEAEQSPQRRSGWQTLLATRAALSKADLDELEGRLVDHRTAGAPVRQAFFYLTSGKAVVTQRVPLPATTRLGQAERALAHSLVFAPEVFALLGVDPFVVFRHVPWLTTVEDAYAQGEWQTGDIPALPVSLPMPLLPQGLMQWSVSNLQQWVLLALQAERLTAARQAVIVVGEPTQVAAALEVAWCLVPQALRCHCTFETSGHYDGRGATSYWAMGAPEPTQHAAAVLVDAQTLQVQAPLPAHVGAYAQWILYVLEREEALNIAADTEYAYALCLWLERGEGTHAWFDHMPAAVCTTVFEANAPLVRNMVTTALAAHLPAPLVTRAVAAVLQQTPAPELYQLLRQGFTLPQLLDLVYQTYVAQHFQVPQRPERRALARVLRQAEHLPLRLLLAAWTGQRRPLQQEVAHLPVGAYQDFVHLALRARLAPALTFLIVGREDAFLDATLGAGLLTPAALRAVVRAVLARGHAASLERLAPHVTRLSPPEIRHLARLCTAHPDIPPRLQEAVQHAYATLPPQGMRGWLARWWRTS